MEASEEINRTTINVRESLHSPVSPSVAFRKEEKNQLVNLNNRLAIYVEKVRSLESQNAYLQRELSSFEENSSREVTNVKSLFESELKEVRKLMDELAKENSQLKLSAVSSCDTIKDQKNKINHLVKKNKELKADNKKANQSLRDKTNDYNVLVKEKEKLDEKLVTIRKELALALEDIESLKEVKGSEILKKLDAENKLETCKEELIFQEKLHKEELMEIRKRGSFHMADASGQKKDNYENRLESAINELREQQYSNLEAVKDELEDYYEAKITDLSKQLKVVCDEAIKAKESGKLHELKVDRLQNTIKSLQTETIELRNQVSELEGEVETERQLRMTAVQAVEKERDEARETVRRMEEEYNELMDTNLKLDHEISIYRKLLEEEEQRLNLSPSVKESQANRTQRTRRKRKRTVNEASEDNTNENKKIAMDCSKTIENHPAADIDQEDKANKSCLIM